MKYYLIAGEASGDLHASHLIAALQAEDPGAEFRGFGGDLMQSAGMTLVRHYRDLAFMGFVAVALHFRTILKGLRQCKDDIVAWQPDVVILVDYPGFNLKIAEFVHSIGLCPVYYYIAPKLWAWKEYRIKNIRRNVDEMFSILPFEVEFFEGKHGYPIHYIGNPTVDEVEEWKRMKNEEYRFARNEECKLEGENTAIIALLAGSRKQEIRDNLPRMLEAAKPFAHRYRLVIAGAPGIDPDFYKQYIGNADVEIVFGKTYDILSNATAALVTSGTATLETALFRVPQVVCYFMQVRWLANIARRFIIKAPYISLVNLIVGRQLVPELVAAEMTVERTRSLLAAILPGGDARQAQLEGYEEMALRLGAPGAPIHAAQLMHQLLTKNKTYKLSTIN